MRPHHFFTVFNLKFQTWGTCFALAALLGFFLLIYLGQKKGKSADVLYNIFFIGFFAGIIGARAFYFLVHPETFSLVSFLYFWQGGYVLFGGAIFALLAIILYLVYKKLPLLDYFNLLVIPALSNLILIRIGSYLVWDNIGRVTTVPWAINFLGQMRHPIDLYFIFLDVLLLLPTIYLFKKQDKRLFFLILIFLSIGRLIIHQFSVFATTWDANANIIFWIIGLLAGLIGFGFLTAQKNKLDLPN
jgi:phosphatidylglycerol:prolipoprotein diacylglycerol transferase